MEVVQGAINVLTHTLLPNIKRGKAKVEVEVLADKGLRQETQDVVVQLRIRVIGKVTVLSI